jgi:hypothetical protein
MPLTLRAKLDPKKFHGFLLRFSRNGTPEDVNDAFCEALEYCDELGLSFADATKGVYGGEKTDTLQAEVRRLMSQLSIEKTINQDTALFRKNRRFCKGCYRLRHVIAGMIGAALCATWLCVGRRVSLSVYLITAVMAAGGPSLAVWARFHWMVFADKVKWKGPRDNELARAIREKWRLL